MNPIFITRIYVNLIMPHMLDRLCHYNLSMAYIKGYLLTSIINGKIVLTYTFIYLLEA